MSSNVEYPTSSTTTPTTNATVSATTSVATFKCTKCEYVCGSKRVLSAHDSAAHSDKVYQCPHCPFVSRYQANFYRHRRIVHKIGRTTCNICSLDCQSLDALVQHKELDHGQGLEEVLQRYEKDKAAAAAYKKHDEERFNSYDNFDEIEREQLKKAEALYFSGYGYEALQKQSDCAEEQVYYSIKNGPNVEVLEVKPSDQPSTSTANQSSYQPDIMSHRNPLKVKRHYTCKDCHMQTIDPREFLYHRKEIHYDRITVHECPYCIYATKHFQKLQRHCGLVHKNQPKPMVNPFQTAQSNASKTARKSAPNRTSQAKTARAPAAVLPAKTVPKLPPRRPSNASTSQATSTLVTKPVNPVIKCTRCDFQCKSRILMNQHEKTVHLRRRFFRCLQCGYVTNERGRYTKHVKYHSLPKVKCEECDFYTTYKWNLDRHMKSHEMDGPYKCTRCTFSANNRQSLSFHLAKHHDGGNPDQTEQEEEEEIDPMMEDDEIEPGSNDEFEDVAEEEPIDEDDNEISNENSLEDFLGSDTHLACRFCSFKTYSKSTLAKHEESHGNNKRYPCPLCGVSFDHVAWLAKHLTLKHGEGADTKELSPIKNTKKRGNNLQPPNITGGETSGTILRSPPSSPPVLKMSKTAKGFSLPTPPRDQKSLIGQRAKKSMPKTSEAEASASDSASESRPTNSKLQHSCTVCSFKSRWVSEIEKHVRVHSLDRPYGCPSCKYRCKWKGDLKRHVVKYHDESLVEEVEQMKTPVPDGSVGYTTREMDKTRTEIREEKKNESLKMKIVPTKVAEKSVIPARSILKPAKLRSLLTKGYDDTVPKTPVSRNSGRKGYESEDTEISVVENESDHGDLVIDEAYVGYEPNVVYNRKRERSREKTPPSSKKQKTEPDKSNSGFNNQPLTNKKYKCTYCPFMSRTASRFHVHIVQHLNKKPFMCSSCFYRSNWEWDITKHIKIKSVRDEAHRHASMLVTDESGRKNYDKYNRFLVDADGTSDGEEDGVETIYDEDGQASPEVNGQPEEDSNYLISPEDVETIVVTPDLGGDKEEDQVESIELDLSRYFNSLGASPEKPQEKTFNGTSKLYYCRHCDFKNTEKKAVVGHLSIHAGTKPFQCRICGMVSNWKHVILRHVKMRHAGGLDDVKNRLNYIDTDGVIELTGYPELASVKPVRGPPKLKKMTPTSTPKSDNTFRCEMCPYTCEKLCYMHFHIKQHKPREGANVKCPYCDYWVNFKKTLNRHLKVHQEQVDEAAPEMEMEEEVPEAQIYGGKNDNYLEDDVQPTMTKTGQKKFQCEFCPYTSDKKRHFLYHKQFHRPNKAAPFKCDYCSYWAMHSHLITQHTKKCHTENKYGSDNPSGIAEDRIPPAVEIFLPSKSLLKQQNVLPEPIIPIGDNDSIVIERNGKKVRMFKCHYCPMMNRRRSNVRAHEEMHSGDKNSKFPCPVCNYHCNTQGVLTSHMKLHTAEEEKQQLEAIAGSSMDFDFLSQETSFIPKTPPSSTVSKSPSSARSRKLFTYFCPNCPSMFKSRSDFETHSSFHGSGLPFPCDKCDYRARHKPHLHKHFLVHSEAYMARRLENEPTSGPSLLLKPASPKITPLPEDGQPPEDNGGNSSTQMSSVNQMLLLEERETSMFLEKGFGKQTPKANQCPSCPATFQKPSVLSFHKYLHGVNGKYYCPHCDYSVNEIKNLKTHQKLHPIKASTVRNVLKIFSCNKCPAVFSKNSRYIKHIDNHGKDMKYTCERCDFSVNLLISLVKHRNVHKREITAEAEANGGIPGATSTPIIPTIANTNTPILEAPKQAQDLTSSKPDVKEKVTYCCNRCPYFHGRRDAMMNHHKRHTANAALQCPHCDYSTLQASFLRDHIKWHFQPQKLIKPNSFMKYSELEVWSVRGNKRLLLFKDHGEDKENERFFSPLVDDSDSEVMEVPTPTKPPALEITIDDNSELAEAAVQKSKQLEVLLTDVFKPSVRKLIDGSETPTAKRRKVDDSQTEDSDADKLVIDQDYVSDEPPVLTPQLENGTPKEVEDEASPDEPPIVVPELPKALQITCDLCPFTTDQLCNMQIHKTRHKPREGAKFKCPKCDYWTGDMKSMKRHLKLHDKKKKAQKPDENDEELATNNDKLTKSLVDGAEQAETTNKEVEEVRTAVDEQEVIDAIENMLQEAGFEDDKAKVTAPMDGEQLNIDEQEQVEMDERDLANEETVGDVSDKMDDEVVVKESDLDVLADQTNHVSDYELEEAALEEDSREIDHTYAEFKESEDNETKSQDEGLEVSQDDKLDVLTPVSSENNDQELLTPDSSSENSPQSAVEPSENNPKEASDSSDQELVKPGDNELTSEVTSPKNTGQDSVLENDSPKATEMFSETTPREVLSESSPKLTEVSTGNDAQEVPEPTPEVLPEKTLQDETESIPLSVETELEISKEVPKESEPTMKCPEVNDEESEISEISAIAELPISPVSNEDILDESSSDPEEIGPENNQQVEDLPIPSPISIEEEESVPSPQSEASPTERILSSPPHEPSPQSEASEIERLQSSPPRDSQDQNLPVISPIASVSPAASNEDNQDETLPSPVTPESPRKELSPEPSKTNQTREQLKLDDKEPIEVEKLTELEESGTAKDIFTKVTPPSETPIQNQLLEAYFSSNVQFPKDDTTSSPENDSYNSMEEETNSQEEPENPVESPPNHEPSSSIKDSIKILSFDDLSPEPTSMQADDDDANEEGPESSVDMDNLIVHDEVHENDAQEDAELSRSEIDMSDMIIHDETGSEQSQQETKDASNQDPIRVSGFSEQEISARDQEASDILLGMASDFFSNNSVLGSCPSTTRENLDPQEWSGSEEQKNNDVLANLLMNAGVYEEDQL